VRCPGAGCPGSPNRRPPRRARARHPDRSAILATVASKWAQFDAAEYPFVRRVAAQLPGHDERQQFLEGIDLILAGIETLR